MVMSQAAIDALMAQNTAKDSNADDEAVIGDLDAVVAPETVAPTAQSTAVEEEIDPLAGTLSAQELARVQQLAAGAPPPPNAFAQKVESEPSAPEAAGAKPRKWAAVSNGDGDLKTRIQELEARMSVLQAAQAPGAGRVPDQQLEEMRTAIAEISETVQGMMAALRRLTEQSKGSLGFAAKQTFDCPECHSHGTISVPIACTACGYESEWGFYPEQK
jgi:hypothetical protein